MAEKKRRARRSYLEDFHETASGDYVYTGRVHPFQGTARERVRALAALWACTALALAALVAGGCLPAAGMDGCLYVLLPYAAALLAGISVAWLMGRLTAGGESLRDYVYKDTVGKARVRGALAAAFCGLTLAGEGVYLALNGAGERAAGTAGLCLLLALALGMQVLWLRLAHKIGARYAP